MSNTQASTSLTILSQYQARPLLQAREEGRAIAETSLDLGLRACELRLTTEGIDLPDGQRLAWESIEEIAESDTGCFFLRNSQIEKVQLYSEAFGRFYTLYPTPRAPTMLVSGIPMHRIEGIDPHEDTLRKIRTVVPVTGRVLDTTTGLGYTAIQAARTALEVTTIELDPVVLEVARRNPWSHELF